MNILIAGIVGIIMLLVGGEKFYNNYIIPAIQRQRLHEQQEQLQQEWQEQLRQQEQRAQQRNDRIQAFLNTLEPYNLSDPDISKRSRLITTEHQLYNLLSICPMEINRCKILMWKNLDERRTRYILQEHGFIPAYIAILAQNFVREEEGANV
ncbi:MAG: hypothetical protein LBS61_03765 [Endomicrobium sp.]|jgi:hypothetical protein|nr:hypothetical protein [Endomicrobium sp.]